MPPPNLPTDPASFFTAGPQLLALREISFTDAKPALERLGPPPFPRGGFPIMGFLATLYEHVAQHVKSGERT